MNRSRVTTDHDEIRAWAEARQGAPAAVKRTRRGKDDTGMIRIDFPGYSGAGSLEPISWEQWFDKFDQSNLAIILQEETAGGEQSHFNKLVARESVKGGRVDKTRSRRARKRASTGGQSAGARGAARTTHRAGATRATSRSAAGARGKPERGHGGRATAPRASRASQASGGRTASNRGSDGRTASSRGSGGRTASSRGSGGRTASSRGSGGRTASSRESGGRTASSRGSGGRTASSRQR
jgi:hypothetical protein